MPSSEGADDFVRIVRSEDQIGAVLRAHLLVEAALNDLLNYKSQRDWSDKYHRGLFSYRHKVEIAVAFGLIRDDLLQPLQILGELRNDMAHRLGHELKEDDQTRFLDKIPKVYLENAKRVLERIENDDSRSRETELAGAKLYYLEGLEGRRAVSWDIIAGLFALLFELWSLLDDLETEDEIKAYEELDEQEGDI